MKKKFIHLIQQHGLLFLSACIMMMILLFVAVIMFHPGRIQDNQIVLPQSTQTTYSDTAQISTDSDLLIITVNPDTVQAVIRTLRPPDSYIRTISVERFWPGGQSSSTVYVWARNGCLRVTEQLGKLTTNYLYDNSVLRLWYNDSKPVTLEIGTSDHVVSALQHIPDYLSLLDLSKKDILEAGYITLNDVGLLMLKITDPTFGYIDCYYISLETGLLEKAEQYDGNTLIYRMTSVSTELTAPADEIFLVPDYN